MKSRFEHSTAEWNNLQMELWHKLVDCGIVKWKDADKLLQMAEYFSDTFENENRYVTWEEIRDFLETQGDCDGRIE